jgi:hypothetical protein
MILQGRHKLAGELLLHRRHKRYRPIVDLSAAVAEAIADRTETTILPYQID